MRSWCTGGSSRPDERSAAEPVEQTGAALPGGTGVGEASAGRRLSRSQTWLTAVATPRHPRGTIHAHYFEFDSESAVDVGLINIRFRDANGVDQTIAFP